MSASFFSLLAALVSTVEVKRFQTIHHCSVDVAHGLVPVRATSLDHLVGETHQRQRHRDPELLRRLHIYEEDEFGGELDRQVTWLFAFEDAIDIGRRLAILVGGFAFPAVIQKTAVPGKIGNGTDCRETMARHQLCNLLWVRTERSTSRKNYANIGLPRKILQCRVNFAQPANGRRNDLHSQNPCRVLDLAQEMPGLWRAVRVENDGDARKLGLDLFEQIDPLAADRELKRGKPGDIAPRLSQARDEALRHRIRNLHEHDRDCVGGLSEMDEIGRGCA